MITRYLNKYLVRCLLFCLGGCIEPYQPEVIQAPSNYLVVDGFINSNGPTTIRLSRTVNLDNAVIPPGEANAQVLIEEEDGPDFRLTEAQNGNYTSNPLQLNPTRRYRLRIQTADGQEYASAYVVVKATPPIDNISWKVENNALQLYVSTHDPQQNTQYYRWTYQETWEFRSAFISSFEFKSNQIAKRQGDINTCWRGSNSSAIAIASTAKLSQDVISNFPLVKLPSNSVKIKYKYSILVKQYGQTREAYEYAEMLKKNTENIGTLFDPLPSQLIGNIQCLTNPGEPVIGFVSVSSVQEKRIFINRSQLPAGWKSIEEYTGCVQDTVLLSELSNRFGPGIILPIDEIGETPGGAPVIITEAGPGVSAILIGYTASPISCVDCRLRGTNIRPDFWE